MFSSSIASNFKSWRLTITLLGMVAFLNFVCYLSLNLDFVLERFQVIYIFYRHAPAFVNSCTPSRLCWSLLMSAIVLFLYTLIQSVNLHFTFRRFCNNTL